MMGALARKSQRDVPASTATATAASTATATAKAAALSALAALSAFSTFGLGCVRHGWEGCLAVTRTHNTTRRHSEDTHTHTHNQKIPMECFA